MSTGGSPASGRGIAHGLRARREKVGELVVGMSADAPCVARMAPGKRLLASSPGFNAGRGRGFAAFCQSGIMD
jgi:hypothetical protein